MVTPTRPIRRSVSSSLLGARTRMRSRRSVVDINDSAGHLVVADHERFFAPNGRIVHAVSNSVVEHLAETGPAIRVEANRDFTCRRTIFIFPRSVLGDGVSLCDQKGN